MDEYGLEYTVMCRCHMDYLDFIADKGLQERIISEKDKNKEKVKSLPLRSITCRFCVRDECRYEDTHPDFSGVVFYFSCFKEEESWWKEDCYSQIVYFLGKPGGYPTFSYSDICFQFSISDRFGWILLYKHMMEKQKLLSDG